MSVSKTGISTVVGEQSGCGELRKELLVRHQKEWAQTIAVSVAMNSKEAVSCGMGALYLKKHTADLILFFLKYTDNGAAAPSDTGKELQETIIGKKLSDIRKMTRLVSGGGGEPFFCNAKAKKS